MSHAVFVNHVTDAVFMTITSALTERVMPGTLLFFGALSMVAAAPLVFSFSVSKGRRLEEAPGMCTKERNVDGS